MTGSVNSLLDPAAANAGLIIDREAQEFGSGLPADLTVVSADNHIEVTENIFEKAFPERLREAAPKVWFDRYWRVGYPDAMQTYPQGIDVDGALSKAILVDGFEMDVRNRHLDIEGIAREIVYPQSLLAFIRLPDQEVQELIYRTYNEFLADLESRNPGRFYGVGVCPNWWDPARADKAIQQIVDLGLKTFMVPLNPGKDPDGNQINYAAEGMDRFWAAAAEAKLPIAFHIAEVPTSSGRGGLGTLYLTQAAPFRGVFGNLIFGGILDRHPDMQIVFAEGGINWVPGALQDAEHTLEIHGSLYDVMPKRRPTEYWRNNMHATFQTDILGLKLLEDIGADRVMWAQDYPHGEGTFGYSTRAMREVVDMVGETAARLILGDNATALYKLG